MGLVPLTLRDRQVDVSQAPQSAASFVHWWRAASATPVLCSPHRPKKLRFHPKQLYFSARQGELQKVLLMLGEWGRGLATLCRAGQVWGWRWAPPSAHQSGL